MHTDTDKPVGNIDDVLDEIYDAINEAAARYWAQEIAEEQRRARRSGAGEMQPLPTYAVGVINGLVGALTYVNRGITFDEALLTTTLTAQSILIQIAEDDREGNNVAH